MSIDTESPLPPFDRIDYRDHFRLHTDGETFDSIEAFATALATSQPRWLTKVSMGIGRPADIRSAIGDGTFPAGSAIGNWEVLGRSDDSIAFGEDMGIMAYRVIYTWLAPGTIDARTEVMQTSRWFGPIYWALAVPLHRRFLPMLLRNATHGDSTVTALEPT